MKPSEILREAAQLIAEQSMNYGCSAVGYAFGYESHMHAKTVASDYFRLFEPDSCELYWFGFMPTKKNQNRRVIALCLAAAIAESEGK